MPKMTVSQSSEKKHVDETREMTFLCLCTFMLLRIGDMTTKKSIANSTKRCSSKGVLYLPYLPSRWSCISWSLHPILIFSITCSLGPSPQILRSDLNMSPFPVVFRGWIGMVSVRSDFCHDKAMGGLSAQFLHARPTRQHGKHCAVLSHMTLLRYGCP